MKKKHLSMVVSLMLASTSAFADTTEYTVIVGTKDMYDIVPESNIPDENDGGVPTTVTNTNKGISKSGDILTESLSILSENGDIIKAVTNVDEGSEEKPVSGNWSVLSLEDKDLTITFDSNSKDGFSFVMPDNFDGDALLTLSLTDGYYSETMEPILLTAEYWESRDSEISDWQIDEIIQDWSPDLSTRYENELVTQHRIIDRSRTIQEKEERPATGEIRNKSPLKTEVETGLSEERSDFYGSMEYWESKAPLIVKDWTVTEVFKNWNPDASTVYETETVEQSREVKKERVLQEQELRPKTGDVRNVGSKKTDTTLTTEYQTVDGELEYWENTGTSTCTEWVHDRDEAWLPDASDFNRDQEVSQTRMVFESRECSGNQIRPKTGEKRLAESETEYQSYEETRKVNGTKINLNDWKTKDSNGSWSVSQDGSYAYQAINGNPTVFESKAITYGNTKISGKIRVRSAAGDDDYIGMVFGMQNSKDFYLWSWKKNNQSINGGVAYEGHFLSHVTGGVGSINWFMEKDKAGYDALDSLISTSVGWNHDTYYDFEIIYTPTKIEIYVEGTKVLEHSGSNMPSGQIGFFNLSQGQVEYYKVTDEPLVED